MSDKPRFFGKYRGTVLNNVDPMQTNRIMVQVPEVLGPSISTWALPCVPFAGTQTGCFYFPPIGAAVWIEFEGGDSDFPIWVGGFWANAGEVPALALAGPPGVQRFVLSLLAQTTLVVSDVPGPTGGFLLKTAAGAMLMINETGITISNGQGATITLTGPTVTINAGALTVT
jgi:uncharacterized protein involved in type VI secretion and phage assembly